MPPRWVTVLIVGCWVSLTGMLLYRDLLPRLLPGQPPSFTVDLTEEAQTRRTPIAWTVTQNGRDVCVVRTRVEHSRHDRFEFIADYPLKGQEFFARLAAGLFAGRPDSPLAGLLSARYAVALNRAEAERVRPNHLPVGGLHVLALSSMYQVNGSGDLLGVQVRFEAVPQALREAVLTQDVGGFGAAITGDVDRGRLTLSRELTRAGLPPVRGTALAEVAPHGVAVVLPLHPPKKLHNLRRGQAWSAVVLDPFEYYLVAGEPTVARARVRAQTEPFTWGRRSEVPCLVIDYEGDRVKVTTWVSEADGAVLCQEAILDRTRWVLYRN